MKTVAALMIACASLGFSGAVCAQEILTYAGNNYTLVSTIISGSPNNGIAADGYTMSESTTGSILLATPLAANLNNFTVDPGAVVFTDGADGDITVINQVNESAYTATETRFTFSTNALGQITDYSFSIGGMIENGNAPASFSVQSTSVNGIGGDIAAFIAGSPTNYYLQSKASNATPGVWSGTITSAPEIDSSAASGALTFLLGGLAVLRGRKRDRASALLSGQRGTRVAF